MRVPAAAAVLVTLASLPARADDPPAPVPMDGVADLAAACTALEYGIIEKAACTPRGHAALADGAHATLVEVDTGGLARWMIVIDDHGALSSSPWLELLRDDGAMHQSEQRVAKRPRLRSIAGGTAVAIELSSDVTHSYSDPSTGRTTHSDSWQTYDLLMCGRDGGGGLGCVSRHRGDRDEGCTGALAVDGTLTTTCWSSEPL